MVQYLQLWFNKAHCKLSSYFPNLSQSYNQIHISSRGLLPASLLQPSVNPIWLQGTTEFWMCLHRWEPLLLPLSHPKLGMNLARSSQIIFCIPWLNRCKIHIYEFSWSCFPCSWDNSQSFLFNIVSRPSTPILWFCNITGSKVVVKSLWLACTSFNAGRRQINAET